MISWLRKLIQSGDQGKLEMLETTELVQLTELLENSGDLH
jgi:hypothetical protein